MSDSNLVTILKMMHRRPVSQQQIAKELELSKSHTSFLVNTLIDKGLIKKTAEATLKSSEQSVRKSQALSIVTGRCYAFLCMHTSFMFTLSLITYGSPEVICSLELKHQSELVPMLEELKGGMQSLLEKAGIDPSQIQCTLFATAATVEQGDRGILYRDNVLSVRNYPLAQAISRATGIKTYVYNYGYGHILSLLHSPSFTADNAMVLMCGDGRVGLGLILKKEIILGANGSFPECSHLPYKEDYEQALGKMGPDTADALYYTVAALAPVFNLSYVVVNGNSIDERPEIVTQLQEQLKKSPDPFLSSVKADYRKEEFYNYLEEFAYLCFDRIAEDLNPQLARSLDELF